MEKKFQALLDNAFAPYANFPARGDVTQELLANLQEKYALLKSAEATLHGITVL
jgi:hypothetical protein